MCPLRNLPVPQQIHQRPRAHRRTVLQQGVLPPVNQRTAQLTHPPTVQALRPLRAQLLLMPACVTDWEPHSIKGGVQVVHHIQISRELTWLCARSSMPMSAPLLPPTMMDRLTGESGAPWRNASTVIRNSPLKNLLQCPLHRPLSHQRLLQPRRLLPHQRIRRQVVTSLEWALLTSILTILKFLAQDGFTLMLPQASLSTF